ncbi:uncharacterized protein [Rutidosis leptorrhynchoides]|uniref:uncharacterized protein n=1 Tax=Rutidosis leptorrhynchoides TaxID=125765 RepID=UPI003A995EDE
MDAPCIIERKCSKHFPKPYCVETTIDEDGYANYRRRKNGETVTKAKTTLDNSFVVPYNRYLLLKYNAHINVEWCNRSRAIKYLFKYLNKGPDRATIVIQENLTQIENSSVEKIVEVDEIKNYLDCRYLSPCEAVWRMFSFDIHFSQPSVIKLSYHLPNQQAITDAKEWTPRKQRRCIGRIVYSNPASGERYYLRMLLNIVKGPQSFEDIRSVNGILHPTFKDACFEYGLINDDKKWTEAIDEATLWASGSQLRDLFVTILLFCNVSKPLKLWEQHWEALSDDILRKRRKLYNYPDLILTETQIKNYCLVEIEAILNKNGKSLADYPNLPQPDQSLLTHMDNRLIREELNYNLQEMRILHTTLHNSLTPEQLAIYEKVIAAVTQKKGGLFFLYGPGGTGKTFVYNTILTKLRSEKMIVLAVASSGIASLLLPGGRTAHSRFVIPLELMENSTCGIKQKTHLADLIQQARLIIWDEAPMIQKYAFEALDKTLRDILGAQDETNRTRLFGGMPILLGGDVRQILPVIPKGKRQEVLDIGDGNVPASTRDREDEATWIKITDEYIVESDTSPIDTIVDTIFPDFIANHQDEDYLRERAILTTRNDDADQINKRMFKKLQSQSITYQSSDEICKGSIDALEQHQAYPVEFLNKLNFTGIPPHKLKLKIGQPIMLLRNLYPSAGMCNGTRLIITDFQKFVIHARIITGSHIGNTVIIPRIVLTATQSKWPFVLQCIQFPVKPCYAMMINKSQGQSLELVGLYLPKPVFSHGQLYMAMSRVTHPDGLKIVMVNELYDGLQNHTRNVVYKETFTNLHPTT